MADDFSRLALLEFLDFLGKKGLVPAATVSARKAAVNTLLSVLQEDEARDLRTVDLDEVAHRFLNLKGARFKPESVRVYRARVFNALRDLKKYREDPLGFRPHVFALKHPKPPRSDRSQSEERPQHPQRELKTDIGPISEVTFPVPIRQDVVVRLIGIPSDLTRKEATKIANVVMALAQEESSK